MKFNNLIMRLYILIALFSGWLIIELKDFLSNGGINNMLAFTLLKIVFIVTAMIITGVLLSQEPEIYMSQTEDTPGENKPKPNPFSFVSQVLAQRKRSRSRTRCNRFEETYSS